MYDCCVVVLRESLYMLGETVVCNCGRFWKRSQRRKGERIVRFWRLIRREEKWPEPDVYEVAPVERFIE